MLLAVEPSRAAAADVAACGMSGVGALGLGW